MPKAKPKRAAKTWLVFSGEGLIPSLFPDDKLGLLSAERMQRDYCYCVPGGTIRRVRLVPVIRKGHRGKR